MDFFEKVLKEKDDQTKLALVASKVIKYNINFS